MGIRLHGLFTNAASPPPVILSAWGRSRKGGVGMCWTRTLARRLATATTGLLALSFVAASGCNSRRPTPSGPRDPQAAAAVTAAAPSEAKPVALFATTEPAKNAPSLVLMPGDRGVLHGWVAGGQSFAGQPVVVRADRQAISLTVRDDNTFTWTRGL